MKVIKNAEILRSNYIPEKLKFREDLIDSITLKINLGAGNLLLYGDTGSGKTASVLNALKDSKDIQPIYINCVSYNNFGSIVRKIIEEVRHIYFTERGKNIALLSESVVKLLTTKRTKKLVFIFDEVDKLINKERDHQQILSVILENSNFNLVLISNDINAVQNLDARIESRLCPEKIFVPQYFANEITEILRERADNALNKKMYDFEAIAYIGKYVFQTSGDLREALSILYESAVVAERKGVKITLDLVKETQGKIDEIEFDEIFAGLPLHQKIIIAGVCGLSLAEKEGFAEHKNLYNFYEKMAKNLGCEAVKFRQFERFLKKLELRKIITITTRSPKDRRGRLVVSFPKFDTHRFHEKYYVKYGE